MLDAGSDPDVPLLFIFSFQELHLVDLDLAELVVADVFKDQRAAVVIEHIYVLNLAVLVNFVDVAEIEGVCSFAEGSRHVV